MPTATRDPIGEARSALPIWPFQVPLDIHSEDFLRLKRLLCRPGHFQLVIAQFNAPRYRDAIIAATSGTESADTAEASVWRLPEQPDLNVLQMGVADHASHGVALHLVGLDHWLAVSPGLIFQGLNYRREGIAKVARLPIVLWLAPEQVRPFAEQAPDLWAWRAAVLDFSVVPQERLSIEWEPLRYWPIPDPQTARAMLAKIDAYVHDAPLTRTTADFQLEAAHIHYALAEWDAARVRADNALSRYREMANTLGAAAALDIIADLFAARGELAEALRIRIEDQLPMIVCADNQQEEAVVRSRIGVMLVSKGDLDEASKYLEQSLAIEQEIGNLAGVGRTLNNLSQIHVARGELDQALSLLFRALAIQEQISARADEGATLNNIGTIKKDRGELDQALEYFKHSLAICQEIGNRARDGTALNNIAVIHQARGELDQALSFFTRALAMRQAVGDRAGECVTLNNLSQIYDTRGELDLALTHLRRSLAIQQEIGGAAMLCPMLFNIGLIHARKGEQQDAFKAWIAAYRQAKTIGLAEGLQSLERLALEIDLPGGLAGWESLAHQLETTGRIEWPLASENRG